MRILVSSALLMLAAAGPAFAADKPSEKPSEPMSPGEALANDKDCLRCHGVRHEVIGPSFLEIARRNRSRKNGDIFLRDAVAHGTEMHWKSGPWPGQMPAPAVRGVKLSDEDVKQLVDWILSLK